MARTASFEKKRFTPIPKPLKVYSMEEYKQMLDEEYEKSRVNAKAFPKKDIKMYSL